MARSITPDQAAVIKATVPVLAQHGNTITAKFYHDLLLEHPSLKNIFNNTHQATGHQAQALAGALYAYAANIDDLGKLSPAVELISQKHASLSVQPAHYEVVGTHLLRTMKAVLGDAATPPIMDAWEAAYWQLADIFIRTEQALYAATRSWDSWQDFRIARKEAEAEEITSLYLEPVDAGLLPLPRYKPGQYVSVNVFVDELDGGVWQARQYSLSEAPGKPYLRISVKKEAGVELGEPRDFTHPGYLSTILHEKKEVGDVVRVSHPFGDFYFDEGKETGQGKGPVVLISAGVGLTCLLSILNTLVGGDASRPISFIHGARDAKTRAFKSHVDGLVAKHDNVHAVYFSSAPMEGEVEGQDYDIKGRLDLSKVRDLCFAGDDKAQYFVCGPKQFMLDVEEKLKSFGVASDRVHVELFGTGGVPRV